MRFFCRYDLAIASLDDIAIGSKTFWQILIIIIIRLFCTCQYSVVVLDLFLDLGTRSVMIKLVQPIDDCIKII